MYYILIEKLKIMKTEKLKNQNEHLESLKAFAEEQGLNLEETFRLQAIMEAEIKARLEMEDNLREFFS
jgi:hypothetical protein